MGGCVRCRRYRTCRDRSMFRRSRFDIRFAITMWKQAGTKDTTIAAGPCQRRRRVLSMVFTWLGGQ